MAGRLQDVTKLELLNHYLDAGSITLINGDEDGREKAGKAQGPHAQSSPHHSPPQITARETDCTQAGSPTPHHAGEGSGSAPPRQPPWRAVNLNGLSLLCKLALLMTRFSQLTFLLKVTVGETKKARVS